MFVGRTTLFLRVRRVLDNPLDTDMVDAEPIAAVLAASSQICRCRESLDACGSSCLDHGNEGLSC